MYFFFCGQYFHYLKCLLKNSFNSDENEFIVFALQFVFFPHRLGNLWPIQDHSDFLLFSSWNKS